MSNVAISNRSIFNQKVGNIEQSKVLLPFNVTKEQENKLVELLSKIKVTFLAMEDKLGIKDLSYLESNIKPANKNFVNSRFTLSKTYVVTMKQNFISKMESFYEKVSTVEQQPQQQIQAQPQQIVVQQEVPTQPVVEQQLVQERPTFSISNETNLQEALAEATAEIDLKAINEGLNKEQDLTNQALDNVQKVETTVFEQPAQQVLSNNPQGETIIENPVNLTEPTQAVNMAQPQPQGVTPVMPAAPQPEVQQQVMETPIQQSVEKPKMLKRFFSKKGNVLAIPIVAIWLGGVFYATMKFVMSILT